MCGGDHSLLVPAGPKTPYSQSVGFSVSGSIK